MSAHRGIPQVVNDQFPQSSHTIFQPAAISAGTGSNRDLFSGKKMETGFSDRPSKKHTGRRTRHHTYLTVFISLPDFIRMPSSVSLTGLGGFATRPQTEYVWYDISRTGCASLGFHPQRNLHVGLTLCVWIILRVLSQALQRDPDVNQRVWCLFGSGRGTMCIP